MPHANAVPARAPVNREPTLEMRQRLGASIAMPEPEVAAWFARQRGDAPHPAAQQPPDAAPAAAAAARGADGAGDEEASDDELTAVEQHRLAEYCVS